MTDSGRSAVRRHRTTSGVREIFDNSCFMIASHCLREEPRSDELVVESPSEVPAQKHHEPLTFVVPAAQYIKIIRLTVAGTGQQPRNVLKMLLQIFGIDVQRVQTSPAMIKLRLMCLSTRLGTIRSECNEQSPGLRIRQASWKASRGAGTCSST